MNVRVSISQSVSNRNAHHAATFHPMLANYLHKICAQLASAHVHNPEPVR